MTDEELKPFIGKNVKVHINNSEKDGEFYLYGKLELFAIGCNYHAEDKLIQCNAYACVNNGDYQYIFAPPEVVSMMIYDDIEPERCRKPTIPKGFIEFKGTYVRADCIVAASRCLCKDDGYITRIETNKTEYFTDIPVDEIMAKIAEALND